MQYEEFVRILLGFGIENVELSFISNPENKIYIHVIKQNSYFINVNNKIIKCNDVLDIIKENFFDGKNLLNAWNELQINCIDDMNEDEYRNYLNKNNNAIIDHIMNYKLTKNIDFDLLKQDLIFEEEKGNIILFLGTHEFKDITLEKDFALNFYMFDSYKKFQICNANKTIKIKFLDNFDELLKINKTNSNVTYKVGRHIDKYKIKKNDNRLEHLKNIYEYEKLFHYAFKPFLITLLIFTLILLCFTMIDSLKMYRFYAAIPVLIMALIYYILSKKRANRIIDLKKQLKLEDKINESSNMFLLINNEMKVNKFRTLKKYLKDNFFKTKLEINNKNNKIDLNVQIIDSNTFLNICFLNDYVYINIYNHVLTKEQIIYYEESSYLELENKILNYLNENLKG